MKIAFLVLMTLYLGAFAFMGKAIGNDFVLYLFVLLAFAPVTSYLAVRYKLF